MQQSRPARLGALLLLLLLALYGAPPAAGAETCSGATCNDQCLCLPGQSGRNGAPGPPGAPGANGRDGANGTAGDLVLAGDRVSVDAGTLLRLQAVSRLCA